jgi:anaerobic selenocysteine-containing dehydrogenase
MGKKASLDKVVKSTCAMCNRLCGVLVHLHDGKVIKVEGDPESPVNRGHLCIKGYAAVENLYHPQRLKYPLKRVGARGEGKWQRISWDEALETIASAMNSAKEKYGAESVAFVQGAPKGFGPYLERLRNLFGTPNMITSAHVCSVPRRTAALVTYGQASSTGPDQAADLDYPPAFFMLWGVNTQISDLPGYIRLEQALSQGTKLVVVDPRKTNFASRADLWVQPRPGTDLALALAMINVILDEELYDKDFVSNWTVGFNRLRKHVQDNTPKWAEEITWVPAEQIEKAARMYATTKPACIRDGNGFEGNVNSVQTARAIAILRTITGNLGIPGGEVDWAALPLGKMPDFICHDKLSEEQRKKMIGAHMAVVQIYPAQIALPQLVTKAILEEKPYPIKVFCIHGSNPLITWSNVQEVYKALMKLDFSYVADLVMTPTAEIADIVLPAATYLEFNDIAARAPFLGIRQKVAQVGECWSNQKIINELGKKLGFGDYFWDDVEESLDIILRPAGFTFEELRRLGGIKVGREYRRYEREGFNTPSGKAEIYSNLLEKWGHAPLPTYREPPETPYSAPELTRDYPLILTSWHHAPYHHSDNRHLATLRGTDPEPLVEIHPETARELGVEDGDMVYIENKRGRIKQRAVLTEAVDPRVVRASYGWWFPEQDAKTLHGWQDSNINVLTPSDPPYNPEIGSTNLRGILCRVSKVNE